MISKDQFLALLEKLREGKASEDEKALLNAYYNLFDIEPEVSKLMPERERAALESDIDAYLSDHISRLKQEERRKKLRFLWISTAAASVIMILSIGIYFQNKKIGISAKNHLAADGEPGGNKAILTLSDGSKIELNEIRNGQIAKDRQITISKTSDGQLIYKVNSSDKINSSVSFNTLETPYGGQYQVVLPDGSHVWLNAASSIRFPTAFQEKERKVEITGEVYFEVAKNRYKPFKVLAGQQVIEVLGTHFNVNAYADEPSISTTLLEGSVKISGIHEVSPIVLKPGEECLFNKANSSIKLSRDNDATNAIAWKNGFFQFEGANLHSIMRQLERWYNVDADIENMPDKEFYGVISRDVKLSQVLKMMELTSKLNFKIIPGTDSQKERRVVMVK